MLLCDLPLAVRRRTSSVLPVLLALGFPGQSLDGRNIAFVRDGQQLPVPSDCFLLGPVET